MQELIPVGCGLLLGAALGYIRPSMRLPIGAALAVVLGVCATVVTGEFKLTWSYVLVDIPLVGLATCLAFVTFRRLTPAWRSR